MQPFYHDTDTFILAGRTVTIVHSQGRENKKQSRRISFGSVFLHCHGTDFLPVDAREEEHGRRQAHQLRNGECPPNCIDVTAETQQERSGQQYQQLPEQGHDGGINTVAQGLEAGAQCDTHCRKGEAPANGPQGATAQLQECRRGIKDAQQQPRHRLEHRQTYQHKAQCTGAGNFQGFGDALRLPCAVVEGDNGNGGIVQAEQRHKEEALELEIDAEHVHGDLAVLRAELVKHLVDANVHHRANAGHDDGGHAYRQNRAHNVLLGLEVPQTQLDIGVEFQIENDRQGGCHPLTDDRCQRRTGDAELGEGTQTENQAGIQDDVDDGAGALGHHGKHGAARGLQQPLRQHLYENTQRQQAADADVLGAEFHGQRRVGHHIKIGAGAYQTKYHEQHRGDEYQEEAVAGGAVCPLLVAFAQGFTQQGIYTHTDAGGEADEDVLHRKGQRHGRNGALPDGILGEVLVIGDAGNKIAVHHVVQRLHQHGDNHGGGHID